VSEEENWEWGKKTEKKKHESKVDIEQEPVRSQQAERGW